MIDKRSKMVDREKHVWLCISCSRRVIAKDKPEMCTCSQPQWVIETNFIVTK